MQEFLTQIVVLCTMFGGWITEHTTLNVLSIIIGMVIATVIDVPLLRRLRRG